ncbi:hypothetical protein D9M71_655110 [compost metagenome]
MLFADIGLARGQLIRRDAIGQVEERLPAVALATQDDALAQRRQVFFSEQRRVVDAEEFTDHEQQAGAAFAQDYAGLGTFHPRIQRHQHRTDALQRAGGDYPFPDIRRPHSHPLADPQVERQQGAGGALAQLVELAIGELPVAILDGRQVAIGRRRGGQHVRNGLGG